MNNLVSIITPSYNSSRFIEDCIKSVISQTYLQWEMLIIDDKSQDDSQDKIIGFAKKDSRIKYFFLEENVGAAEARNIAIRKAEGRYIAFLDSDDLWIPEKLEKQIAFMQDKDIAFSFSTYDMISEDGSVLNTVQSVDKMSYDSYLKNTIIGCLTVIIDKEKTGSFEMPDLRSSHDMALWLLIMKRGFYAYGLDDNLAKYRVSSFSNTSNKFKAAKEVWVLYRDIEKLNFIYSTICFISYAFHAIKKRI